jgi:hypothetical protein
VLVVPVCFVVCGVVVVVVRELVVVDVVLFVVVYGIHRVVLVEACSVGVCGLCLAQL